MKFRGVQVEDVCKFSTKLVNELEIITGSPRDYFTLECIHSTFIMDGEMVDSYPFVEIVWFDRGQKVQDEVAKTIHRHIVASGYPNVNIFFTVLHKSKYYENGEHY